MWWWSLASGRWGAAEQARIVVVGSKQALPYPIFFFAVSGRLHPVEGKKTKGTTTYVFLPTSFTTTDKPTNRQSPANAVKMGVVYVLPP